MPIDEKKLQLAYAIEKLGQALNVLADGQDSLKDRLQAALGALR
jgi:hypothetical protein